MRASGSGYTPYALYPPNKQAVKCVKRTTENRPNVQVVTYVYEEDGSNKITLLKAVPPIDIPLKEDEESASLLDSSIQDDPNIIKEEDDRLGEPLSLDSKSVPQVAAFEEVSEPSCSNNQQGQGPPIHRYPKTYVERSRRWTYKSEASVATADEDGQLYYNPDPYRPAPPAKGAPSTLTRMHYAAQRIDNRKYRGQRTKARATNQMESASCDRCKMRFFLPYNHFRSHISYALSTNRYALPLTFFNCPVCHADTQIFM